MPRVVAQPRAADRRGLRLSSAAYRGDLRAPRTCSRRRRTSSARSGLRCLCVCARGNSRRRPLPSLVVAEALNFDVGLDFCHTARHSTEPGGKKPWLSATTLTYVRSSTSRPHGEGQRLPLHRDDRDLRWCAGAIERERHSAGRRRPVPDASSSCAIGGVSAATSRPLIAMMRSPTWTPAAAGPPSLTERRSACRPRRRSPCRTCRHRLARRHDLDRADVDALALGGGVVARAERHEAVLRHHRDLALAGGDASTMNCPSRRSSAPCRVIRHRDVRAADVHRCPRTRRRRRPASCRAR